MKKLVNWIVGLLFVALVFSILLMKIGILDRTLFNSFFSAVLINLLNFASAVFLFKIAADKSNKVFLIMTLGGMGARLLLVALSVGLIFKFLNIEQMAFILHLFILYFCLLAVEIKYYSNFVKNKSEVVQ